ncbi:U4/U5/U6 small nuclear ribonucleoprotein prp3 [Dispira simplex]|nr:U4/U5/U6 small nuclear ribonucleoprotein prp3 [Dispira simplex]
MSQTPQDIQKEIQRKIEEAKARIQALTKNIKHGSTTTPVTTAPTIGEPFPRPPAIIGASSTGSGPTPARPPPPATSSLPMGKGGLHTQVHPSLMVNPTTGQWEIRPRTQATLAPLPKAPFATARANRQAATQAQTFKRMEPPADFADVEKNPYFDPKLGLRTAAPKARKRKGFHFVPQGKYINEAERLRTEAHLERLKQEVAAKAKQTGIRDEDDLTDAEVYRKSIPPPVEWWDTPFLPHQRYDEREQEEWLSSPECLVTHYVQHPVPTESVVQTVQPAVKPLMLTKKERKKLRRQRRAEIQRERQDKIRLGLLPPDPPKVKLTNLMRVLANESVQDPTKVEAEVRRQVAARREAHEKTNQERQLTPEQRRAKKQQKLEEDEQRGIYCAAFCVLRLTHRQHKYKVDINAQQLQLTGVVILHPQQCLVVVEGGAKSLKAYKKLMLQRIQWSDADNVDEPTPPTTTTAESSLGHSDRSYQVPNTCHLLWEGQIAHRHFSKFRFSVCPTDTKALVCLGPAQMQQLWGLAKACTSTDEPGFNTPGPLTSH